MIHKKGISGNVLWRLLALLCICVMLFSATACSEEESSGTSEATTDLPATTAAQMPDGTTVPEPTVPPTMLTVKGTTAGAGDKAVTVTVDISGNTGILGMDFDVYYDADVMTLVDAKSAIDDPGCVFTPPAYYRNPTSFLWDFQDAGWGSDGTILTLTFDISETAPAGEYEVKLMYSYGNIFDADANPIDVKVMDATITVEES